MSYKCYQAGDIVTFLCGSIGYVVHVLQGHQYRIKFFISGREEIYNWDEFIPYNKEHKFKSGDEVVHGSSGRRGTVMYGPMVDDGTLCVRFDKPFYDKTRVWLALRGLVHLNAIWPDVKMEYEPVFDTCRRCGGTGKWIMFNKAVDCECRKRHGG